MKCDKLFKIITFLFSILSAQTLEIEPNPGGPHEAFDMFSKYVNVHGVGIFSVSNVSDSKVLHAANVMAEYLDNNENGIPDNTSIINQMVENNSSMVIFTSPWSNQIDQFFEVLESNPPNFELAIQDLYGTEINPNFPINQEFDATLEENLHLICFGGYSYVYPEQLGEWPGTDIADAMDIARGGFFWNVPNQYPDEAWYHYDDTTCDYGCQITEYWYWALTSLLGAQNYTWRCNWIADEWELCSPEQVQTTDVAITEILTNPLFIFPTKLPDGTYFVRDLTGDGILTIDDVITLVDIMLDDTIPTDNQLSAGDVNSDSVIDVFDVVLLIDIILL
tara:strand:- start:634 stop:1638 length:1005 start_codon:yes stop_codon:yes gene_type:complete